MLLACVGCGGAIMNGTTGSPFSGAEALRLGWAKTKTNMKPLLIIGAVGAFFALLQQALSRSSGSAGLNGLLILVLQVLQVGVTLAYIRIALKLHDGQAVDLARGWDLLSDFFSFLLTSLLQGLIVAVGFILLIVPGIVWALKFGFAGFVVVDEKLDPFAALRESNRLAEGVKWHLFGFALLVVGINLLGAVALGIGLLVAIPTTLIATAHVFRRLQAREASRSQQVTMPGTIPPMQAPWAAH
jgi:uncharacterized membrane protein